MSRTATILFADIRGYTSLASRMDPIVLGETVSVFQDRCAESVWAHDGIVNKHMGDGLMAILNVPITVERRAEAAILAGFEIHRRCRAELAGLARQLGGLTAAELGVGVGIHTGVVEIGQFSMQPSHPLEPLERDALRQNRRKR